MMKKMFQTVDEVSTRLALQAMNHQKLLVGAAVVVPLALLAVGAEAGTTAAEFKPIYDKILDWTSGYLGKAIALFAFLLGLGAGVAKQSPMAAIGGVVFALFVAFGPAVLEGIATATL